MSAAFKLAKKKVSQHDLRRIMQEQKQSRNDEEVKIDSPFAKWADGQLTCQLCKSVVRSAAVWKVHVNTKAHKENLALAKELKEKLEVQARKPAEEARLAAVEVMRNQVKRMRSEANQTEVPEKKIKGILKNSSSATETIIELIPETSTKQIAPPTEKVQEDNEEKMQVDDTELPEGFFDDPKKDAKARHLPVYKDKTEEEWDKFQKEIKEVEVQSMNIINEEQEEATVERQIDEIDAQIKNWSRFVFHLLTLLKRVFD
jgi:zinc finger protein 830